MDLTLPKRLYGLLLSAEDIEIKLKSINRHLGFIYKDFERGSFGWELYQFTSPLPLQDEDELNVPGPYIYPVFHKQSESRNHLILSVSKSVVEYIKNNVLPKFFNTSFWTIRFDVHKLVKDIIENPKTYSLTSVHTRVDAFGISLKSASFYGEDIGESGLFRHNFEIFSCFTCGLKGSDDPGELISIKSNGRLSFYCESIDQLANIERVLGFIRKGGFYVYSERDYLEI